MSEKTYRAIRHDVVRQRQASNANDAHHPDEKITQLKAILDTDKQYNTLELFAGHGNMTEYYASIGKVQAIEKVGKVFEKLTERLGGNDNATLIQADSFRKVHEYLLKGKRFDILDIDPYGFPNRFFPDAFLLIDNGYMIVTMPKPYVNILNGITQAHLISYYGEHNPSFETIVERIALWGICHWRQVELIDHVDCKSVWRMVFKVDKVKATEYTGVRNR